MKQAIKTMVESIKKNIVNGTKPYYNANSHKLLMLVLEAYNDFQESERDGVDYIFDLYNGDDLRCCVEGGMSASEIAKLYEDSKVNTTSFFHFGCNYPEAKPYANIESLRQQLISWLDELLENVIAYPYAYESYKQLYTMYVTNVIVDDSSVTITDIDALKELKRKMERGY
jgi:hypothetical protein